MFAGLHKVSVGFYSAFIGLADGFVRVSEDYMSAYSAPLCPGL